jgi:hypothetical protein
MTNENKIKLCYQKQTGEILNELITKDFLPKLEKMLTDDLEEEVFSDEIFENFKNQYQNLKKQLKAYNDSDLSLSFNAFLIANK